MNKIFVPGVLDSHSRIVAAVRTDAPGSVRSAQVKSLARLFLSLRLKCSCGESCRSDCGAWPGGCQTYQTTASFEHSSMYVSKQNSERLTQESTHIALNPFFRLQPYCCETGRVCTYSGYCRQSNITPYLSILVTRRIIATT